MGKLRSGMIVKDPIGRGKRILTPESGTFLVLLSAAFAWPFDHVLSSMRIVMSTTTGRSGTEKFCFTLISGQPRTILIQEGHREKMMLSPGQEKIRVTTSTGILKDRFTVALVLPRLTTDSWRGTRTTMKKTRTVVGSVSLKIGYQLCTQRIKTSMLETPSES